MDVSLEQGVRGFSQEAGSQSVVAFRDVFNYALGRGKYGVGNPFFDQIIEEPQRMVDLAYMHFLGLSENFSNFGDLELVDEKELGDLYDDFLMDCDVLFSFQDSLGQTCAGCEYDQFTKSLNGAIEALVLRVDPISSISDIDMNAHDGLKKQRTIFKGIFNPIAEALDTRIVEQDKKLVLSYGEAAIQATMNVFTEYGLSSIEEVFTDEEAMFRKEYGNERKERLSLKTEFIEKALVLEAPEEQYEVPNLLRRLVEGRETQSPSTETVSSLLNAESLHALIEYYLSDVANSIKSSEKSRSSVDSADSLTNFFLLRAVRTFALRRPEELQQGVLVSKARADQFLGFLKEILVIDQQRMKLGIQRDERAACSYGVMDIIFSLQENKYLLQGSNVRDQIIDICKTALGYGELKVGNRLFVQALRNLQAIYSNEGGSVNNRLYSVIEEVRGKGSLKSRSDLLGSILVKTKKSTDVLRKAA